MYTGAVSMTARLTVTRLRKELYRVIDRVLETGIPVEVERNGKRVVIAPVSGQVSKLANLKRRKGIVGDPEELVELKVGQWQEHRNLG
jgi:hypothetical protein